MIRLENILKISLQDVFKTFLQDVLNTSRKRLEDVWPRRIYWSWPIRLEDVFWRCKAKANIFVLIKTSWRRLEDVFWRWRRKTPSRRLQEVLIKTNVCWAIYHLLYLLSQSTLYYLLDPFRYLTMFLTCSSLPYSIIIYLIFLYLFHKNQYFFKAN